MLIITRRMGESMHLTDKENGNNSKVIVLGVKGNQVRLGIEAPQDINILREELIGRDQ